jgi:hypothetical protein
MAEALQWVIDNNIPTVNGRVIKIEYNNQDMVPGRVEVPTGEVTVDPVTLEETPLLEWVDGYVEELFVVGAEPEIEVDGVVIPEHDIYLTRLA